MPDVKCPRCRTDLHDHGAIAWPVEMDDPGRAIYRCATDGCGPLAVVEGDQVTWYYPNGGEELALLRAERKAASAANAAWMMYRRDPVPERLRQAIIAQDAYAEAKEGAE